jgi:UDP-2,4-diacetamido-2,4,6-trideoxy-beta-L-altropyranose hydrolase
MTPMRVVFRADASLQTGTGHVMRCLTLAEVLRQRGASCAFICRSQPGHLMDLVRERGYECTALPEAAAMRDAPPSPPAWLGVSWDVDARETLRAIGSAAPHWLVVDHYALDARWASAVRAACRRLMVIDDLADRPHDCHILLDQNLGRLASDYGTRVPAGCRLLVGPAYALLRPEFAGLRAESLSRRRRTAARKLLISLGGVDAQDWTGRSLDALAAMEPLPSYEITTVMGATAPWLEQVRAIASSRGRLATVVVNAPDLASRMAQSDLAIGAAGTTAWERCCLGLPTLLIAQAANQRPGAEALCRAGAAILLPGGEHFAAELQQQVRRLFADIDALARMQEASAAVTDGLGAGRVATELFA